MKKGSGTYQKQQSIKHFNIFPVSLWLFRLKHTGLYQRHSFLKQAKHKTLFIKRLFSAADLLLTIFSDAGGKGKVSLQVLKEDHPTHCSCSASQFTLSLVSKTSLSLKTECCSSPGYTHRTSHIFIFSAMEPK